MSDKINKLELELKKEQLKEFLEEESVRAYQEACGKATGHHLPNRPGTLYCQICNLWLSGPPLPGVKIR